ncbi:unnamed protein product, partial [marine sediment metagenome]
VGNNLYAQGGLNVGPRGIYSGGEVSVYASSSQPALTVIQNSTGDILNLYDNSTEVFTVLDGGNVGIGTTSPTERLHLNASNFLQTSGDPVTKGNWDPDNTSIMDNAFLVYVSGKYAYVVGQESDNLVIVDISDPSNPTTAGNWKPGTGIMNTATSVYISGRYAYVAGGGSSNLAIVDISDPTNPTTIGNWTPNDPNIMDGARSVYISGKYAYVAGGGSDNLVIVDISNPTNPTTAGNWKPGTSIMEYPYSVYISGRYAYVV